MPIGLPSNACCTAAGLRSFEIGCHTVGVESDAELATCPRDAPALRNMKGLLSDMTGCASLFPHTPGVVSKSAPADELFGAAGGPAHRPALQVACAPVQTTEQAPQCCESLARSTQCWLPHAVRPGRHAHSWSMQVPPDGHCMLLAHTVPIGLARAGKAPRKMASTAMRVGRTDGISMAPVYIIVSDRWARPARRIPALARYPR